MFGTAGQTVAKVPVEIPGITGATGLALGDEHACARTAKGEVWCWGNNLHKQLGTLSPVAKSAAPVKVVNLPAAGSVAAISDRSCAVTIGGEVWCWGLFASAAPASIGGPTGSVQIAVGDQFTCARTSKDEVWCWGDNSTGQCGNGNTMTPVTTPVGVGPKFSDIQAGLYHACGLTSNSTGVYCWGANDQGQTGASATEGAVLVPTIAAGTAGVTAIAVGTDSVLARAADGSILCWGRGDNEECLEAGAGSKLMQAAVVPSLQGGITFTTGASSCVLAAAPSTVLCWGSMSLTYPEQSQIPFPIAWK